MLTRRGRSRFLRGFLVATAAVIVGTMPAAAEIEGTQSPGNLQPASQITLNQSGETAGALPAIPVEDSASWSAETPPASPTGHEVSYRFKSFYDNSGGLPVFGYAISPPVLEHGQLAQYFERQRFEHHPEHKGTPYEVLLGRLGVAAAERAGLLDDPAFQALPKPKTSDPNCDYVAETGHQLCLGFRAYWQQHGLEFGDKGVTPRESLALFGYPISEEFTDPASGLRVQYFERARFEYHPENPEPNTILLGLLAAPAWAEAEPTAELAPESDALSQEIAATALQYLGTGYAWGGTTPAGFDCSGFIYFVVNKILGGGYPRMLDQMLLRGTPVNRNDLQPGDIVFQENTYTWGISHGGIYLGNGQFIHAENESTGVVISDLWSDYWATHYLTARRLAR